MNTPVDETSQALTRTGDVGLSALADSPLPVFTTAQMLTALASYKDLQRALDNAMPDQIMDLDGKKFRKKGYWRALAVAFKLNVEPIDERREVSGQFEDGRDNFGYVVTYRASAGNGRIAIGDGSCFAVEKARRFKCPHPEREGSRRTKHFPHSTCPDFDPHFQWRSLSGDATEHNVRSHAHTRAYNRAVSNLVGFGEVSAEEIERDEPTHDAAPAQTTSAPDPAPRPAAPAPPQARPSSASASVLITEQQTRRLYAKAMDAGMSKETYRAFLKNRGFSSDRDIPTDRYDAIVAEVEAVRA